MKSIAPLQINFAPRTFKSVLFSTPLWVWMVAVLGIGLLLFALFADYAVSQQGEQLSESMQHLLKKQKAAQKPVAAPVLIPQARALMINATIAQLNLPWSDVFDAIEAATPSSIALVAIEPDAKKQLIKGTAEALNSDDMIAYIELLKKQPLFVNVVLSKHEVNQQDPYKPFRFEFAAQWKEAAP